MPREARRHRMHARAHERPGATADTDTTRDVRGSARRFTSCAGSSVVSDRPKPPSSSRKRSPMRRASSPCEVSVGVQRTHGRRSLSSSSGGSRPCPARGRRPGSSRRPLRRCRSRPQQAQQRPRHTAKRRGRSEEQPRRQLGTLLRSRGCPRTARPRDARARATGSERRRHRRRFGDRRRGPGRPSSARRSSRPRAPR